MTGAVTRRREVSFVLDRLSALPSMKKPNGGNQPRYNQIVLRDGLRCALCKKVDKFPTLDHIISRGNGGDNDPSNLRILCNPCHNRKDNTPRLSLDEFRRQKLERFEKRERYIKEGIMVLPRTSLSYKKEEGSCFSF